MTIATAGALDLPALAGLCVISGRSRDKLGQGRAPVPKLRLRHMAHHWQHECVHGA